MELATHGVTWLLACQAPSIGEFVTVSELSELLRASGVTARQAAKRAEDLGIELPYGTIAAYWTPRHPQHPSEETLEGLAAVTNLSLRRLRRVAGMAEGEAQPWTPPPEANRLTRKQRDALEQLIKVIVAEPLPSVSVDEVEDWPPAQYRGDPEPVQDVADDVVTDAAERSRNRRHG